MRIGRCVRAGGPVLPHRATRLSYGGQARAGSTSVSARAELPRRRLVTAWPPRATAVAPTSPSRRSRPPRLDEAGAAAAAVSVGASDAAAATAAATVTGLLLSSTPS